MKNQVINYFVSSNSSMGFVSLAGETFGRLRHVERLSGWPPAIAADILDAVCARAAQNDIKAERIHNCLNDSLEGVILPELSAGVVNFPLCDTGVHNILNVLDDENLSRARRCLREARQSFARGLKLHAQVETIYIANTDFDKLNALTGRTIEKLLGGKTAGKPGERTLRFFGAATAHGARDYIENITEDVEKRYFIKGRAGTGKSTFLKKVARAALDRGFDAEAYPCALDPNSLDMLLLPELSLVLFDSTAPHEYFPSRASDEIIDVYKEAVAPGTDEAYEEQINAANADYKAQVAVSTSLLRQADENLALYQKTVLENTDSCAVENVKEQILTATFGE